MHLCWVWSVLIEYIKYNIITETRDFMSCKNFEMDEIMMISMGQTGHNNFQMSMLKVN